MDYGGLIKDAYRIALHNPRLWVFGIFAGTSGGFSFNYSTGGGDSSGGPSIDTGLLIALLVGAGVLALVLMTMSILSQGALVDGVAAADRGERPTTRDAFRAGRGSFWRMAGFLLLMVAAALVALIAIAAPVAGVVVAVFAITGSTVARLVVCIPLGLAAVLTFVAAIFLQVLVLQLGTRALVLDRLGPITAVRAGWRVLRANKAAAVLTLLIQLALQFAAGFALVIALAVLSIPAIVVLIATSAGAAGVAVAAVTALVLIPAAFVAYGAIGTFGHGMLTLGYLRMTSPAPATQVG